MQGKQNSSTAAAARQPSTCRTPIAAHRTHLARRARCARRAAPAAARHLLLNRVNARLPAAAQARLARRAARQRRVPAQRRARIRQFNLAGRAGVREDGLLRGLPAARGGAGGQREERAVRVAARAAAGRSGGGGARAGKCHRGPPPSRAAASCAVARGSHREQAGEGWGGRKHCDPLPYCAHRRLARASGRAQCSHGGSPERPPMGSTSGSEPAPTCAPPSPASPRNRPTRRSMGSRTVDGQASASPPKDAREHAGAGAPARGCKLRNATGGAAAANSSCMRAQPSTHLRGSTPSPMGGRAEC